MTTNRVVFFFQAEDGIRDADVTGVRRVLFRSTSPYARRRCSWVQKAARLATLADGNESRLLRVAAAGDRRRAAWMEGAAARPVERMRDRAADGRQLHSGRRLDARDGLEQRLGIRMLRVVKDVVDLALLDYASQV